MAVLDASAALAIVNQEPGHQQAQTYLGDGIMSAVNWGEVCQKLCDEVGDFTDAETLLDVGLTVLPYDRAHAQRAATLYRVGKPFGLSLADRACLAVGLELGLPVVTADLVWAQLMVPDLTVSLIRS